MTGEFENAVLDLKTQIVDHNDTSGKYHLIQKIKRYIDGNYSERLSLDQLSQDFFISPSYLSKIFKEATDENLSDYILNIRMNNAKRLLMASNEKIQEISRQVGYDDYRHFCTIFKRLQG